MYRRGIRSLFVVLVQGERSDGKYGRRGPDYGFRMP